MTAYTRNRSIGFRQGCRRFVFFRNQRKKNIFILPIKNTINQTECIVFYFVLLYNSKHPCLSTRELITYLEKNGGKVVGTISFLWWNIPPYKNNIFFYKVRLYSLNMLVDYLISEMKLRKIAKSYDTPRRLTYDFLFLSEVRVTYTQKLSKGYASISQGMLFW